MNEVYRAEIIRIVNDIDNTEVLRKIYTLADLQYKHLNKEDTL